MWSVIIKKQNIIQSMQFDCSHRISGGKKEIYTGMFFLTLLQQLSLYIQIKNVTEDLKGKTIPVDPRTL
jgi:hypothetical protein